MMRLDELSRVGVQMVPGLVNHLWQSTLFAVAAGLVAVLLRGNSARARYRVWLIASAKFLIPFSLLTGLGGYFARPQAEVMTQSRVDAVVSAVAAPVPAAIAPRTQSFAAVAMSGTEISAQAEQPAMSNAEWVILAVLAIWLCGGLTVFSIWLFRWAKLLRVRRAATVVDAGREIAALRRMEETAGVRQASLPLLLSREPMEPGILGVWRPVLLWPERISEHLEERHLEAIFAHELEHVRQRDNLFATLHMLVQAMFWFHPLLWWMGKRMVAERERACDEAVLRGGNEPIAYAESILKTCEFCVEAPLACVSGITGADLKQRMVQIMSVKLGGQLSLAKKLLLAVAAFTVVAVPVVLGQRSVSLHMAMQAPVRPLEKLWTPMLQITIESAPGSVYHGQHELYSLTGSDMMWWPMSLSGEKATAGLTEPRLLNVVRLSPPAEVFTGKVEMKGQALVGLTVDRSGTPTEVHVVRGLGAALDAGAVDAVSKLRFAPATLKGTSVPFALEIIADFDHVSVTVKENQSAVSQQLLSFFSANSRALPDAKYRLEDVLGGYGDNGGPVAALRLPAENDGLVMNWMPPGLVRPSGQPGAVRFCAASYAWAGPVPGEALSDIRIERSCGAEYDAALRDALEHLWIVWPQTVTLVNAVDGSRSEFSTSNIWFLRGKGFVVVTSDGRMGSDGKDLVGLLQKMGAKQQQSDLKNELKGEHKKWVNADVAQQDSRDLTGTWQAVVASGVLGGGRRTVMKIFKGKDGVWHTSYFPDIDHPGGIFYGSDTGLALEGRHILFLTYANGGKFDGILSEDGNVIDSSEGRLVRAAPGEEWPVPIVQTATSRAITFSPQQD